MKKALFPFLGAALLLAAAPAQAQFPGNVPDTFRLQLGGIYAWFDTSLTFEQTTASGTTVGTNLENVLGLPDSKGGFLGAGYWNFAGRSFIDFGYVYFSRTRTETISRDIVFGDTTYTAGAEVSTSMKSGFPYVDYRYGFVKSDAAQFGLSLGVAWINLKTELTASAGVVGPSGPVVGATVTKTAKLSTPVPALGLMFEGRLADNLSAGVRVLGIFASISPYSGYVIDGQAHIDWYLARNFGIGAGYQYTKFNVEKDQTPTLFIDYSYRFDGPTLYLILTF
jgi:hypothetical protein